MTSKRKPATVASPTATLPISRKNREIELESEIAEKALQIEKLKSEIGEFKGTITKQGTEIEKLKSTVPALDWGKLQSELDTIDDIKDKIGFLQSVVTNNPSLCFNTKCPIFNDIIELRNLLTRFRAENIPTRLELIQSSTEFTPLDRDYALELYESASYECDLALQEIMRVASVNKSVAERELVDHERQVELIRELTKSGLPLPTNVKLGLEKSLDVEASKERWQEARGIIVKKISGTSEKSGGDKTK